MVGTPRKMLTLCRAISWRAPSPLNRGIMTMVTPARSPALRTTVWPKVWNSGSPPKRTSPGLKSMTEVRITDVCSTRAKWVPRAPFGLPVVPEV